MRCFVAIDLSREVIDLAVEARGVLTREDHTWTAEKWVTIENLHITLAFWEDLSPVDALRVGQTVRRTPIARFDLSVHGFVFMPKATAATMAWLRFADDSGSATALAGGLRCFDPQMSGSVGACSHRFIPHATIVRARHPHGVTRDARDAVDGVLARSGTVTMSVPNISVFSSTLTSSGPRYERLERVDLRSS